MLFSVTCLGLCIPSAADFAALGWLLRLLQVNKNKVLVDKLAGYLPAKRADLDARVCKSIMFQTGFTGTEVFRKSVPCSAPSPTLEPQRGPSPLSSCRMHQMAFQVSLVPPTRAQV